MILRMRTWQKVRPVWQACSFIRCPYRHLKICVCADASKRWQVFAPWQPDEYFITERLKYCLPSIFRLQSYTRLQRKHIEINSLILFPSKFIFLFLVNKSMSLFAIFISHLDDCYISRLSVFWCFSQAPFFATGLSISLHGALHMSHSNNLFPALLIYLTEIYPSFSFFFTPVFLSSPVKWF